MNELLGTLAIHKCRVIRAPTDRPEISYNVKMCKTTSDAKKHLVKSVKDRMENCSPSFRGLVYCRSKTAVEEIAEMIDCKPFHADRPEDERKASFTDWVEGKDKFIVSRLG